MRSKNNLFLLVFGILFVSIVSLSFGEIENVSHLSKTPSNLPWVQPFGDKVMVVWREEGGYSGSDFNIYYTVKSGGTWSKPKAAYNTGEFSKNPNLALGPDGTIHMVWADGVSSNRDVYYGKYQDGAWQGNRQKVSNVPYNSNWMRIGVYDNGVLNVIWANAMTPGTSEHWRIMNNWKSSGSWPDNKVYVSDNARWNGDWDLAMHPDIYCRGDRAFVVWHEGTETNARIKFSEKQGNGNWSKPIDLTPYGTYFLPGIVVDSDYNVHVLTSSKLGKAYYTNRINGVWSPLKAINQVRHSRSLVNIDIDNDDMLHAVYRCGGNIYYNYGNKLGIWSKEVRVSNGSNDQCPCVCPDNQGYVHIVWTSFYSNNEDGDVMYTRFESGQTPGYEMPVARFTHNPDKGEPPLKVSFDASSSSDPDGSIVAYNWTFGDGTSGTGKKINHTFNKKGVFVITLTVKDNDGLTAMAQGYVSVTKAPVADFTMNPSTGVIPALIHFDASASHDPDGSIASYTWDFGDEITGAGKTVSHLYTETGDYPVTLEVVDNMGASGTVTKMLKIVQLYAPLNVQYTFKTNRNLFSVEYFYEVTWESNPLNAQYGINVTGFKIYRRRLGTSQKLGLLASVNADTFTFYDRGLTAEDEGQYRYRVSCVDDAGNESVVAEIPGLEPLGNANTTGIPNKRK